MEDKDFDDIIQQEKLKFKSLSLEQKQVWLYLSSERDLETAKNFVDINEKDVEQAEKQLKQAKNRLKESKKRLLTEERHLNQIVKIRSLSINRLTQDEVKQVQDFWESCRAIRSTGFKPSG